LTLKKYNSQNSNILLCAFVIYGDLVVQKNKSGVEEMKDQYHQEHSITDIIDRFGLKKSSIFASGQRLHWFNLSSFFI
jgi:predicted DNA-binding protein YlxM (UPF0122 family)